ncbi:hypothetical protein EV702DRAFT_1193907 [Suillus placidus]|uniref:Uncharacterized protein n=1 Tax=Suillus placidus TaxID=48579 RepID=A0A9P7D6P2_9AGAM|nr:hypothetical protein EV702DRAFT_1193907 [Suillus placidus]
MKSSPPGASIDIDAIKPLLRFSKLRELHLLTSNPIRLSDEEFATMGASWPNLEVINLNDGYAQADPSMATLPINTNVSEGIEERPTLMVGANGLQYFVLTDTTVDNTRAVAFIVSLVFPKAKKIVPGGVMTRVILAR